jgi:hypothetical protein
MGDIGTLLQGLNTLLGGLTAQPQGELPAWYTIARNAADAYVRQQYSAAAKQAARTVVAGEQNSQDLIRSILDQCRAPQPVSSSSAETAVSVVASLLACAVNSEQHPVAPSEEQIHMPSVAEIISRIPSLQDMSELEPPAAKRARQE